MTKQTIRQEATDHARHGREDEARELLARIGETLEDLHKEHPGDKDAIGRVATWLREAVEAGVDWRDMAEALVNSTVSCRMADGSRVPAQAVADTMRAVARTMADRLDASAEGTECEDEADDNPDDEDHMS